MQFRSKLIALVALVVATGAQAQIPLDTVETPRAPSTPTPTQPLVAPGLPSRPQQPLMTPAPATAPAVPAAPAEQGAGRTVRVEQQQTHPSGVMMTLTSVTFQANAIIVAASILNLSDRPTSLNRGGSLVLVDDQGRSHPFVPPTDNPEVRVAARSRVAATFVFAGPLAGDTRSVQISTNGLSGSRSDRLTSAPSFLFRVPVS
ncbi:hypothetical protein KXR53_05880 [Inquilinus limosus]|uniref:hypothetical protein n=1 Tax=Inquilinus limosus TaxID=171674 RepID=UPI003F1697BD